MHHKSIHNKCGKCAKCQIFDTFATPNTKNAHLLDVLNVLNFCNMLQYHHNFGTVWTDVSWYNLLFYSRFSLSSSHISLSFRLLISVFFLISVFSIRFPQHADHQWPLNAADLTKDHHSMPPTICLLYFASGSFFFFFHFFFFTFTFFCCGLMGGFGLWVMVVGGFGLWVMAVGGLRWVDRWWVGSGCGLWRWVGRLVMGESVVGESVMANQWWCRSLF